MHLCTATYRVEHSCTFDDNQFFKMRSPLIIMIIMAARHQQPCIVLLHDEVEPLLRRRPHLNSRHYCAYL